MGKTVDYNGYTIESVPFFETNRGKWRVHIFISVRQPSGIQTREFSTDVLYETEAEADVHGITFGQRIIDGRVVGQTVWDMKFQDRRAPLRFKVQFRTAFCVPPTLDRTGSILDLSAGGCRVESSVSLMPGVSVELRIFVPGLEWPLMIEVATVQWISGQTFGLAFFQIRESERQRLEQVLRSLVNSPA